MKVRGRLNKLKEGGIGKLTGKQIINMSSKDMVDIVDEGVREDLLEEVILEFLR